MSHKGTNNKAVVRWGCYAITALAVAMVAISQFSAKAPPRNIQVYGCYVANTAPAILLNGKGMSIQQKGFPRVGFHLERHDTVITLATDVPVQAEWSDGAYRYLISNPGESSYFGFVRIEDGQRYDQTDDAMLSMFKVVSPDGNDILYNRISFGPC